jgi:hypothetical protein
VLTRDGSTGIIGVIIGRRAKRPSFLPRSSYALRKFSEKTREAIEFPVRDGWSCMSGLPNGDGALFPRTDHTSTCLRRRRSLRFCATPCVLLHSLCHDRCINATKTITVHRELEAPTRSVVDLAGNNYHVKSTSLNTVS